MIGGATRGRGGSKLGRHLADAKKLNEQTWPGSARGLVSDGILDRIAELGDIASHARSQTPLYHVHADPDGDWSDDQWSRYWDLVEHEFRLASQPYAEAVHVKGGGRQHRHRVYSLVQPDGTCVRLDHDYARREKLHRLIELETGASLTPGRHNRAVIAALEANELTAGAAEALRSAGLYSIDRPVARTSPRERAQAERTGVGMLGVGTAVLAAWRVSDTGQAFQAALADQGLVLAQGGKVPVVVDRRGGTHPLVRLLAKMAKAEGSAAVRSADVAARLKGLELEHHVPGCAGGRDDRTPAAGPEGQATKPDEELTDTTETTSLATPSHGDAVVPLAEEALNPGLSDAGPAADPASDKCPGAKDPNRASVVDAGLSGPVEGMSEGDRAAVDANNIDVGTAAADGSMRLVAALDEPASSPDPLAALEDALARSDARTARILSREPWPDPRDRDGRALSLDAHEAIDAEVRHAQQVAITARVSHQEAEQRLGLIDRLAMRFGRQTVAVVAAQQMAIEAERLRIAADTLSWSHRSRLDHATAKAADLARIRKVERRRWAESSATIRALRERHGNNLVRFAIAAGDGDMVDLALRDLAAARLLLLRHEDSGAETVQPLLLQPLDASYGGAPLLPSRGLR